MHPLRGAAPVTGRDTRSEGVHCLRIGCAPNHKNKRGQFVPTDPNRPPRTLRHNFDMLARPRTRGATPVTSRYTRYVATHPIRRGAMPTDRVHRLPQQAQPRTIRPHRPQPSTSDAATQLRHARPAPNERRYTRYVAIHPLRRTAPVTSRCTRYVAIHPFRRDTPDPSRYTRSERVQCLRIGCTAPHNKPN